MGLDDSAEMCDATLKMMEEVAADGSRLLDASWDPLASLASKYPEFAAWRTEHTARTVKAPDGSQHAVHKLILAEARSPTDAAGGNGQATARTIKLAEEMANAAVVAMRDPRRAIHRLLLSEDGEFSVGKDPSRNAKTKGAHATNDRVESNFACVDLLMRMFRYATVESISGMAQQM
eukprot:2997522-Prymnesium_polylepis.1